MNNPVIRDRAWVRQALGAILVSDSDLNAFCLDYFPEVHRRFTSAMDRTAKENLLLEHTSLEDIQFCLQRVHARPLHLLHLPKLASPPHVVTLPLGIQPPPGRSPQGWQPPRGSFDPRWYVSRSIQEDRARNALNYRTPVVLYGPELYGKTWLLHAIVASAKQDGYRVAMLNLLLFEKEAYNSLDRFLHKLAFRLFKELDLPAEVVDRTFASSPGGPIDALNEVMRHVLRELPGTRLVLAIDNVDQIAITGQKYQDEFFSLLRAWAQAGDGHLTQLHLVLCISTAPALLINEPDRSPFNLGDVIQVSDLDDGQVAALASLHGMALSAHEQRRLRELIGGHPYLVRLGLYEACIRQRSLGELLHSADIDDPEALYSTYLDHLRNRLNNHPAVRKALGHIVKDPVAVVDDDAHRRLEKAGIIVRERRDGRVAYRLRHLIYRLLVK